MKDFFSLLMKSFFKPKLFFSLIPETSTWHSQMQLVGAMIGLMVLFHLVEWPMGAPLKPFPLIVQMVLTLGFLFVFPLVLSIAVNIAGGRNGYREALNLTTHLFVVYLYYLLLIPMKAIMIGAMNTQLSDPAYNRMLFVYPAVIIISLIFLFMAVHLFVMMFWGIQKVHQLSGERSFVVMILSLAGASAIEIILLIPVYAFVV